MSTEKAKKSTMESIIAGLEKGMRFIPPPVKIFLWLIAIVSVIAAAVSLSGVQIIDPSKSEAIVVQNPISKAGLMWLLSNFTTNITGYMAFGPVLVMLVGIGICEETGVISAVIRRATSGVSDKLLPLVVCFIGVMGNLAENSSIFVLTPIAGFAYLAIGRNPALGMITCYMANISGMSANLVLTNTDVIATNITNTAIESAALGIEPLNVSCNMYFMAASAVVMTITTYLISEKILSKVFLPLSPEKISEIGDFNGKGVSDDEKKALRRSGLALLLYLALIALGCVTGFLKDEKDSFKTLLNALVVLFFFGFILIGYVYGKSLGKVKGVGDLMKMAKKAVSKMSGYIALIFVIGQFTALLSWTKLTKVLSAVGSEFLLNNNLNGVGIILIFILICSIVNIFITSMSAMYNIFAPVAVPILARLGWSPALTQAAFRIADSGTNIWSPMSAFLYMMLDMAKETFKLEDSEDSSVAKWLSCLLPAGLIMTVIWILLLLIWIALDLPLGPGASIHIAN